MRSNSFIGRHFAAEAIDFQSPLFFKELTLAYQELKGKKVKEAEDGDFAAGVIGIIKRHTNMVIGMDFGSYDPCVEIPMVDKNNILINNFIRNYTNSADGIKLIAEAGGVARGTVSLKTGKVTGIWTNLNVTIHMPTKMLVGDKYSAEECAAITLHEVGHILTYCEFITRTVTTNQVLAGLSKALDGSGSIEQREAALISVQKALSLKELDVKALAKSRGSNVAEVVVIANEARKVESELGHNVYDFNTWEMLADQYAARLGAGRYIVTGLDKLYRGMFNISFRSTPAYLAMEALKFAILIGTMYAGPAAHLMANIVVLMFAMDGSGDGTYDRPGARFQRVRNQLVEALKDKKLPKKDIERFQADLVAVDDVLARVNDRRQLIGVVWDTLVPSARRSYNQERLQRELEDLALNDLFVKAAKLKQVA